jgi:cell division protein FtsB
MPADGLAFMFVFLFLAMLILPCICVVGIGCKEKLMEQQIKDLKSQIEELKKKN